MFKRSITKLVVLCACASGISAFADTLSTTGSVSVSNSSIQFYPLGGASGTFAIGPPETGVFSSLAGTTGSILDLTQMAGNSTTNIPDFMTFAGAPNLSITLTEVNSGTLPACTATAASAGQACTPTGTPYNLLNQTATSSTASVSIEGYLVNSNNLGVMTPLTGVFTSQFVNMSYQQLIADINSGQSIASTYSAEFVTGDVTATPEPGTVVLLVGGLLALGAAKFRSRKEQLT